MECFSLFWNGRRFNEGTADLATSWYISDYLRSDADERCEKKLPSFASYVFRDESDKSDLSHDSVDLQKISAQAMDVGSRRVDLREVVKNKADKHRRYYRNLCEMFVGDAAPEWEVEQPFTTEENRGKVRSPSDDETLDDVEGRSGNLHRQRRTGVYEMSAGDQITDEMSVFKSVRLMREKYQEMLERTSRNLQETGTAEKLNRSGSVDGLLAPPVSGYCSSTASAASDDEREKCWTTKHVVRCSSSDSALGLTQSDDETTTTNTQWIDSRDINPTNENPHSPRGSVDHINVPTKTLIEAQCVQLPLDRKLSDCLSDGECDKYESRRASCFTDDGEEHTRYRFWRTPSIVVSDYSDDVVGLTLEDIEYFRNQRKENSSSPDSSVHSSCSNLNYCGSTISSLDSEYILRHPFRKSSDCSTCSTLSGDEETDGNLHPPTIDKMTSHVRSVTPPPNTPASPSRSKSLMESILVAKMEQVSKSSAAGITSRALLRTDSVDSTGSLSSVTSTSSDVCRCDDCLLGIGDLYAEMTADRHPEDRKKPSGWRKLRNIVQWTPFFQTYKKQRYPWVQLAGHQGNFKAGPDQGTILKKLCAKEEKCFKVLMRDVLRPYVPEYKGLVTNDDGECCYLQLQDLLGDFVSPCVMDCKIGVRTYLEEELAKAKEKPKLRKDMYEKMCQIDKNAPTDEEHRIKGVTKPRYMVWRETISSTATLGFRIEGIRRADGTSSKDFKTTKSREQIMKAFVDFTDGFPHAIPKYIQRLKAIKATLESSKFFATHEVIGSSLLFVHDRYNANVWLIDFAKTVLLPDEMKIDHSSKWVVGNHEDGYLIGVENLISIFITMLEQRPIAITPPPLSMNELQLEIEET